MRKLISAILLVLAFTGSSYAQTPIARFIFEDAEAAFAKQDYPTTLAKLDEAEKEFGKLNHPILYLRIMARNELLKQNPQDFDTVERLRGEVARYFKEYGELESVQDKAREVYRVLTELGHYPTLAEYEAQRRAEEEVARTRRMEEEKRRAAEEKRREDEARRLADARKACPDCIPEMVIIPAGSFYMGSVDGQDDEKPIHQVAIAQPFEIGKYEVTQSEWQQIMGTNPSDFDGCGGNCPVENVSWNDVHEFLNKLNQKTGMEYRLPTEAEWEYACRAGGRHEFCGSDDADSVGWTNNPMISSIFSDALAKTHPVGQKQANAFGIYDMTGNVMEWVRDSYHRNYDGAPLDGSERIGDGKSRIARGGSYLFRPNQGRASSRIPCAPDEKGNWAKAGGIYGFRLARTLP